MARELVLQQINSIYLCSPKRVEGVNSLPMITFSRLLDSINLEPYDTLLFTSKQALYYIDEISNDWKNKQILAVGVQTAKTAKELGAKDIYHPKEFYGSVLANDIIERFADAKILYIRPKVVSFDSKSFLSSNNIAIEEAILYETTCLKHNEKKLPKDAIIIFTSPSTIECFFKNFQWQESYRAVVIGKSTLTKLPKDVNAVVANEPTINACIERAQNL